MNDEEPRITLGEALRMLLFVLLLIVIAALIVIALFPPDIIFRWL